MHPVFDVPEIILLMGEFLPTSSLATCALVCKSWHRLLAPLLYKTITNLHYPSIEGMARHAQDIRELSLQFYVKGDKFLGDGIPVFFSHPSLRCHNLRVLTLLDIDHDNKNTRSSCEALILLNQQLRTLWIGNGNLEHSLSWSTIFTQCSPFLQNLVLVGCSLNGKETALLMELGRRLTKLIIDECQGVWSEFTAEPQFPMMKSLTLEGFFERSAQELCWITQCPKLERLKWTEFIIAQDSFTTNLAFGNLQIRPWKHLQRLELAYISTDSRLARILAACGPLREVSVRMSGFWYRSLSALEKHTKTLERLRLYESDGLQSWMCQWIATSFPNLRSLKFGRVFAHELVSGLGAEEARAKQQTQNAEDNIKMLQEEIASGKRDMVNELDEAMAWFAASRDILRVKPWACQKLERLAMFITFPLGQEVTGWDEQVFGQISKLKHLKSLNIGQAFYINDFEAQVLERNSRGLQLKLGSGLSLLAPLKKLDTLKFVGTGQNMDDQDLLWILNQWPGLAAISRYVHEDKNIREKLWPLVVIRDIELLPQTYDFGNGPVELDRDDESYDSESE